MAASIGLIFPMGWAMAAPGNSDQLAALGNIEVIDTAPLPGMELQRNQFAGAVQGLSTEDIHDTGAVSINEVLNRQLGSVFINDIQGNPFQADINYRGFTASPLLGTAQGLSVYMDGVRLNQPFGDVVSWDLIPRAALKSSTLVPGSNPVFGLNTLGGALVLQTKDGRSNPGTSVQGLMGSHGRQSIELEHGGNNAQGLDWYTTLTQFSEDGWRVDSPSDVQQFFGKVGWRNARTQLKASLALADNELTGNGLQESRLLAQNRNSVYTKPDITDNQSALLNLEGTHALNDQWILAGNLYARNIKTKTFNGDINEDSLNQNVYLTGTGDGSQANHTANRRWLFNNGFAGQFPTTAETTANTPFPKWACIAQVGLRDEPGEKCNGLINRGQTNQDNLGLGLQLSSSKALWGKANQFTVGLNVDHSKVSYQQSTQLGYLNPDRSVAPLNAFADGVTGGDVDGAPFDNRVNLNGTTKHWGIYATNTLSMTEHWHLTLAGRLNHTRVKNRDQILPGGGPGSLDGDHRFDRFNPAVGLAYSPSTSFNAFASYNEGSRSPSSIELGCADPANPCKLPNALAGDPALKQVVTQTTELGIHGITTSKLAWRATMFRADNKDDLLFVADNAAGFGYFKNFGKTRREGVELGGSQQWGRWFLNANYTHLQATFESPETVNGEANSSADANGRIQIAPGQRIPLVPRHVAKVQTTWQATDTLKLALGMTAVGESLARGNENGQHQADGRQFLGSGKNSGYALFDLGANLRVNKSWNAFAQVNNLFDRQTSSAAQLGATGFDANGNFVARPFAAQGDNNTVVSSTFFAPGAPRTAWVGVRYTFDR